MSALHKEFIALGRDVARLQRQQRGFHHPTTMLYQALYNNQVAVDQRHDLVFLFWSAYRGEMEVRRD